VEGLPALVARLGGGVEVAVSGSLGPLRALATPGHSDDSVTWLGDGVAFTGDAVLGEGSVFVAEDLGEYLEALHRLRQLPLRVICPGHGPPVWDPQAKLDEYVAHRRERERKLLDALEDGLRDEDELLDAVWADAPPALRPAAAVTLGAHRAKLESEGRWPQQDGGTPAS
jgi:glyoxylase-like metal-dependent hydrolase (beta-lactamase superfamily II)